MNLSMKHVLCLSAGVFLGLSVRADWYVATEANGGNDNNAGTADAPFLTIAKGVTAATAGNYIVHVGEGEFPISTTISISKKVSVIGAGRDKTTVLPVAGKSCARGFYLNHAEAEIACLRVTGMTGTGNSCGGMGTQIDTKGGTVRDCLIEGNSDKSCYYISNAAGISMAAGKVVRTVIVGNMTGKTSAGGTNHGGGVYMTGGVLESCLVVSNKVTYAPNKSSSFSYSGGGVYATGGRIVNCTIADNDSRDNGGGLAINGDAVEVVNTLIQRNTARNSDPDAMFKSEFDQSQLTHCATYFNFGSNPVSDVELNDPAAGDYSLAPASRGIEAGKTDGVEFASETDLEGRPRLRGGKIDIGCYQYDVSVPAVGILSDPVVTNAGGTVALSAVEYSLPSAEKTYSWTLVGSNGSVVRLEGNPVECEPTVDGFYSVTVAITNVATQTEVVSYTRTNCFYCLGLDRYVGVSGSDDNSGLSADDAFATIEKGVDEAIASAKCAYEATHRLIVHRGVVHVGEGGFTLNTQVPLDYAVKVVGAGADRTFVSAIANLPAKTGKSISNCYAAFTLTHDEALLEDLTVWKCKRTAMWLSGLGVYLSRGTVRGCTICNNAGSGWHHYGAGVYMTDGLVDHCVITNNSLSQSYGDLLGAGIYMAGGRVENSLIAANSNGTAAYDGAGVYVTGGTLLNCTIAGNKCGSANAGLYIKANAPQVINCLIGDNLNVKSSPATAADVGCYSGYDLSLIDHCAIPNFAGGTETKPGSVDLNPDYTPQASSSAIDAGRDDAEYASPGDLAGLDRKSGLHVDAGCYEYNFSGYSVSFNADKTVFTCGETVTLTPIVIAPSDETKLTYAWTITGDNGVVSNYADRVVETSFDLSGHYTVSLVVTDPRKGEAFSERVNYLYAVVSTLYVATEEDGGSDDNDGQTPQTPLLTVSKAVAEANAAAYASDRMVTVKVAKGVYLNSDSLVLSAAVSLVGAGADVCTLTTAAKYPHGVQLNNADAVLSGFTLKGFRASGHQQEGIGVHIAAGGGTVRDCVITDNSSGDTSTAYHVKGAGARIEGGTMLRCKIVGNTIYNGYCSGGGVYISGGRIESCLVAKNSLSNATADETSGCGGGILATGGEIVNCTVVGNSTSQKGGGVSVTANSVRLVNCVISWNAAKVSDDEVQLRAESPEVVSCYTGAEIGADPILGAPEFRDFANGDYTLLATSDLIDRGCDEAFVGETDLAGNLRVSGVAADIGCYELDQSVFCCCGRADVPSINAYDKVNFSSRVFGAPSGANLSYAWAVDNGEGVVSNYTGSAFSSAFDYPGYYTVTLTVTDSVSGEQVSEARAAYLYIVSLDRYVSPTGNDANSGLDPEHPFGTMATAVAKIREVAEGAGRQATLHLASGSYPIAGTLALSSAVHVKGDDRDTTFVVGAADFDIAFSLSHDDAVLSGITVTNIVSSRGDRNGVGLYMTKGEVRECRITKCSSGSASQWRGQGAGVYMKGGVVRDTIIEKCSISASSRYGAGISMAGGSVERCLIRNNFFPKFEDHEVLGGGVYMTGGALRNCSIVGNRTEKLAGGVYAAGANAVVENCLIAGNTAYEDDCDTAPDFRSGAGFVPANLQNCFIGKLEDAFVDEDQVPLAGSPLIAANIGWKQYDTSVTSVGFCTDRAACLTGEKLTFTGACYNAEPGTYSWTITPPSGDVILAEGKTFEKSFDIPGAYGVSLTVSGVGTLTRETAFRVGATTIEIANGDDLSAAVEDAVDGAVIRLAAGDYPLTKELVVDKRIDIVGAGRDQTVIRQTANARAMRILGGGRLQCVTVTGGVINKAGGYANESFYGAGIWLTGLGGTVADCRITNSRFSGVSSQCGAGLALWSSKGRVTRTLIDGNSANVSSSAGGGAYVHSGVLDNCVILTNSAVSGGGVWIGTAGAKLMNCVLVGNSSSSNGGGLHMAGDAASDIANCVFVGNTSSAATEFTGYPQWSAANYPALTNAVKCCAFVDSDFVGEGSFSCEDAKFVDEAAGDYRITLGSPLRFKGLYEGWMREATDFWGNPRVVGRKRVDIGAFQTQGNGMMLMVK